jgi:hypothetical protein
MSVEITAMWTLGRPLGIVSSTSMNLGKLAARLACDRRIDDDVSTTNSTSRFRLAMIGAVLLVSSGGGAQAA